MNPSSPAKLLAERCRTLKHVIHGGNAGHVPLRDVGVKSCRTLEHRVRVGHGRHVPPRYISVERLRTTEQGAHVDNLRHISVPDGALRARSAISDWRYGQTFSNGKF